MSRPRERASPASSTRLSFLYGHFSTLSAVVVPSAALRVHTGPTDQYALEDGAEPTPANQFLDDMTLAQLEADLGVPVVPGGANLSHLLDHLKRREAFHTQGMNLPQGAYNP
jgi:hypothetical protein